MCFGGVDMVLRRLRRAVSFSVSLWVLFLPSSLANAGFVDDIISDFANSEIEWQRSSSNVPVASPP